MRLLLIIPFMAACLGTGQTCVMDRLTYSGSANGQVLVKILYTNAQGISGQSIVARPNVQLATFRDPPGIISGGGECWGGAPRQETADAVAWIDASARLPSGCNGVPFDECAPQASDPQGRGTFAIRDGEQNYLDIAIKDP
jgi:hypothetical protein